MNIIDIMSDLNNTVKFTTYNPYHQATVTGKIISFCDNSIASTITDIANYHSKVSGASYFIANPTELPPLTDCNFIIIQYENGDRVAYAAEWIKSYSYAVITDVGNVDIRLYNVSPSDVNSVMKAIFSQNISAKIITD